MAFSTPNNQAGWFAPLWLALAGVSVSLLFCFAAFPYLNRAYHTLLDPDGYGLLGRNLYHGRGFTFSPPLGPTLYRGPLYPALIAIALGLTSGWYPQAVWVIQSLFVGLTCWLVFLLAETLWDRKTALWAGWACAFYPLLFWYAPRMWTESLLSLLVTAVIYFSILFLKRENWSSATALGLNLGLLVLVKEVFLPLALVLPVLLYLLSARRRIGPACLAVLVAIILVAPWTARNYAVSGRFVPVHAGFGTNLKIGNFFARHWWEEPLSYAGVWARHMGEAVWPARDRLGYEGADDFLRQSALAEIARDPTLVLKKIFTAGLMFWYIGEDRGKTLVQLMLRLPVLLLAALGAGYALKRRDRLVYPGLAVVLVYWLAHLPFAPPARLSVPVLPFLVALAASVGYYRRQAAPGPGTFARNVGIT